MTLPEADKVIRPDVAQFLADAAEVNVARTAIHLDEFRIVALAEVGCQTPDAARSLRLLNGQQMGQGIEEHQKPFVVDLIRVVQNSLEGAPVVALNRDLVMKKETNSDPASKTYSRR